jgi:hypothetical protein
MPQRNRLLPHNSLGRDDFSVETLEPRIVLTGYFAVGVEYNGAVDIFNEFGDYDSATGNLNSGSRESSDGNFTGSPFAGFTFGNQGNFFQGGLTHNDSDPFGDNRITVGFGGPIEMGFSVGYSGQNYQTPIQVNYFMNQATGLGTGSGGRDGDFFFNGVVRDVNADTWSFNHGSTNINGLDVTGSQKHEGAEIPFAYQLNPNAIFNDGFTLFNDSTSTLFFSDDLTAVQQTDLDGSDGFQSYSLGMRVDTGTNFSSTDFAGDVFGLAMTGSPELATFFGQSSGSAGGFTYTGALEFADDNTFRMYGLDDFYAEGRDNADTLLKGTFAIDGDDVTLTTFDSVRSLGLKFNSDLRMTLPIKYNQGEADHHLYGAGARIRDGATGDFDAAQDDGDVPPPPNLYTDVTTAIGGDGTNYVIGKTDANEEIRFNISAISGLDLTDTAFAAWLEDGGTSIEVFGTTDTGVHYARRGTNGFWSTDSISTALNEIPATGIDVGRMPDGSMTLGGFNSDGDLLRFDCVDDVWTVNRLTDIPAPDGEPGTPTGEVDLLVTDWSGWHLFYLDSSLSLRAAWTTPTLGTYFDNNLSQRAGLPQVDGQSVHATVTDQAAMHVGLIDQGQLHDFSWKPSDGGSWGDTAFGDVFGAGGTAFSPAFVGTHFDSSTGDLLNIVLSQAEDDLVFFLRPTVGEPQRHSLTDDLHHPSSRNDRHKRAHHR